MQKFRPTSGVNLCNGPAKLCQAFSIDMAMNGHDLRHSPLQLIMKPQLQEGLIISSPRIGISKAKDTMWRFYIHSNVYVK